MASLTSLTVGHSRKRPGASSAFRDRAVSFAPMAPAALMKKEICSEVFVVSMQMPWL
ncbi:MAG TPA: hypothetical protein PK768_07645 [Tepidanaerobacteraceae bacterium]|nr:hypothetical protein [Tepidanaerobacteraceae bacterium]